MAKTRVYELAKELGMDSKEFLEKLIAAGVDVSSHMSSMDETDVERARREFGGNTGQVIEEKRVTDRVIRRRRKRPKVEATPPESVQQESAPEAVEAPPAAPEAAVSPEKGVEEPPRVPETPPVEPGAEEPAPAELEAQPEEQKEAAPAPASPEAEAPSAPAVEEPEIQEAPPIQEPEHVEEEAAPAAAAPPEAPPEEAEAKRAAEAPPEPEAPKAPEAPPKPPAPKAVKPKKKSKDTPARIIKMPEPEPERAREPVSPLREERKPEGTAERGDAAARMVEVPPAGVPVPEGKAPRKKKARKKGEFDALPEEKPKRIFRKKEIIEREDLYEKDQLAGHGKRAKGGPKRAKKTAITMPKAIKRRIKIGEAVVVAELAKKMGVKAAEVVKKLMALGVMVNINQPIDYDTAALLAAEFGFEITREVDIEEQLAVEQEREENLEPRPPVVTVMGHVDHGKTSLLDWIRKTNVTSGEAGGITQHIGAYKVAVDKGEVVFLDTPGHEAFTSMRARGAQVTDMVVLVVAADDGVQQQTREAIDHARAGDVPIIVALNKIDKANADPERVKRELAETGLVPEEWGGDTIVVPVSAKTGEGIPELLEYILLQAELMELKADPTVRARGIVIEAKLDKGRGAVATVLVQSGTLRVGDPFVCGKVAGRVRAMIDDQNRRVKAAVPSTPVEVQGFSEVPSAGDDFVVVEDEKTARMVSAHRKQELWQKELPQVGPMTLEKLHQRIQQGEAKELNLVLKTDVQGSLEAITSALQKMETSEVAIRIVHSSTGSITESDVMLAAASNAIVIGFNVRPAAKARQEAEREKVELRFYDVIYELLDDIRDAMVGLLEPTYEEKILGRAEVREVFHIGRVGTVAGCYVTNGKMQRGEKIRVLRDNVVVYTGEIGSVRRFKEDVKEVSQGYECGIHIANFNDVKVGDELECFAIEEIQRSLD